MALATAGNVPGVYVEVKQQHAPMRDALDLVLSAEWTSSNLPFENAFTRSLVLRTFGVLASEGVLPMEDALGSIHHERPKVGSKPPDPDSPGASHPRSEARTLRAIVQEMVQGGRSSFAVMSYSPAMTLGYWFLDAVDRLEVRLQDKEWESLASWLDSVFSRQMSLAASHHSSLMDPVAMAMAACGSVRLRRIASESGKDFPSSASSILPSEVELREGIRRLFKEQNSTGIWPKYFSLFHYPDGGSNFTFSFEMLEAVLHEFGESELIEEEEILEGLRKAVEWCEVNRLEFPMGTVKYRGWNSGGQPESLSSGKPESWATATVHMFLNELDYALSSAIDQQLLTLYAREGTRKREPDRRPWERDVMDTEIALDDSKDSVKGIIEYHLMKPALQEIGKGRPRNLTLPRRRSALLFGPPGTSKTRVVKAFADALGWPFVEINPSHFLTSGLNNIYGRTNEVFDDLLDLRGAVVLFDELDALVRRRPGGGEAPLDVTREFLTTSMLPKLIELHDRGQVFYFMATNHRDVFDEAITRSGRFDLHIFMGVPTWKEKLSQLERFLPRMATEPAAEDVDYAKGVVGGWVEERTDLSELLDWFSFGETKSLFEESFGGNTTLRSAVDEPGQSRKFEARVRLFADKRIGLRKLEGTDLGEPRKQYELDRNQSRVQ